ncbi:hypothetical protein UM02592.1 [Paecilomyces variotii No. 5]|uniref:6-phosphogluconate dehydrogenase NADP-binding domain-containing protein n=1 Tax=Byssochlamys spectabilis (strain No. 5 / NBRC 109023) TaxID=1356009 RepID=V5I663_BYSSN|nr:hypothetical protein UM02592.1 [Paecilomyces variotii No. 5]
MASEPPQTQVFGFVGLGNMGMHLANNLSLYAQEQQFPKVKVWNRTPSKSQHLAQGHCEVAGSIPEIGQACTIVHGCLGNDDAALSVYRQLFSCKRRGAIYVDHSTLFPATAERLQEEAREYGVAFLSCPVFGPPAAAQARGLLIALSGDPTPRDVVKSYFIPSLGKGVIDCGDNASNGALLKILGNNCILGTIELLSESFALAEKTGFDANVFYDFIQQWFPAPAWINYGKKIRDGAFSGKTGFTIPGGMKDASYIRRLGAETSTPTPIIDQAWNHLTTAKAIGGDSLDWSSCSAGMRVTAGLKPFKGEDFTLKKDEIEKSGRANDKNGV